MPLVPFTAHIPDSAITDLRERLARTRWPEAKRCVSRSANEVITEQ